MKTSKSSFIPRIMTVNISFLREIYIYLRAHLKLGKHFSQLSRAVFRIYKHTILYDFDILLGHWGVGSRMNRGRAGCNFCSFIIKDKPFTAVGFIVRTESMTPYSTL